MPRSVLEAIKMGIWDFEPPEVAFSRFAASDAMPGTEEKLCILAERARKGLPLWHVQDRDDVESPPPACSAASRGERRAVGPAVVTAAATHLAVPNGLRPQRPNPH